MVRYVNEYGSQTGGPILEVGCAAGYLGEVLRKQGFEVWGVETNAAAVIEASNRLNDVFHGSIEDFLLDPAFAETEFQFVISGDVIEHLVHPVETLVPCKRLLQERGGITTSIPNVAHRSVRLMLLESCWEYDAVAIMDVTHLHFYIRDSHIDLFTETGYAVQRFSATPLRAEDTGIAVNHATSGSAAGVESRDICQSELRVFRRAAS